MSESFAQPKVSVIIPCYAQAHYLSQSIGSVLNQTYTSVEAIVIDDGSPDDAHVVAARFGTRVKIIRQPNQGLPRARNAGFRAANSDFVLFLDADDALADTAISQFVAESIRWRKMSGDQPAVIYGTCQLIDADGNLLFHRSASRFEIDPYHDLLRGNELPPLCFLIDRRILEKIGPFNESSELHGHEDWELLLRTAAAGFAFVSAPKAICMYRVTPGSMSKNVERMYLSGCAVLSNQRGVHSRKCHACRRGRAAGHAMLRQTYLDGEIIPRLRSTWSTCRANAVLWLIAKAIVLMSSDVRWIGTFTTHVRRRVTWLMAGRNRVSVDLVQ